MAEADPQKTFDIQEAEAHFSRLIDRAHAGHEIVVVKDGVPYAKLMPIAGTALPARRKSGRFAGLLGDIPDSVWFDPLPEDELKAWEGKYSRFV